jgi:hypothetical protein
MSESAKAPEFIHVERLLEAPIIYADAVPKFSVRAQILSVTLAVTVGELVSQTDSANHLVAVADLRMTAATAHQLRDLLDKALLAMQPTPGPAN